MKKRVPNAPNTCTQTTTSKTPASFRASILSGCRSDETQKSGHARVTFCRGNLISSRDEKNSFLNYNVSCILTTPQYTRQGYGKMLIDFTQKLVQLELQQFTWTKQRTKRHIM
ncbi:hypothetical protein F7725_004052 [Dissostichus mawsoni]|uniref:Histone acetyltransferase n=1 Tax=Dissostichus mawsoni TaxID=36200 RepID=A0A7J5YBZ4_DISMA|nr:hypothetical protein F7725_004052 [Dissostichus mawsoni]